MSECRFCFYLDGAHDMRACPEPIQDKAEKARAVTVWHDGWDLGRSGEKLSEDASPTFVLGYLDGVRALEGAQNGEPFFCQVTDDHDVELYQTLMDDLAALAEAEDLADLERLPDLSGYPDWSHVG